MKIEEVEPSHLARYKFASAFAKGRVLDVPCGSGYGTKLLSEYADSIVGTDIHEGAIGHAREFFSGDNIQFEVADAQALPFTEPFDTIVSFEGIEHLKNPDIFLKKLQSLLAPDGRLIISTPRKPHGSPYHFVEFSLEEYVKILSSYFNIEKMYGQIFTDIFDMKERKEDPHAYTHFNFIAFCKPL